MTEEEQIRAEVERRKQRARDLKIVDNVFKLYREHLCYLKADFNHDQNCMPKSVSKVVVSSSRNRWDAVEQREIFLGDKAYSFGFRESSNVMPDNEVWRSARLEVRTAERSVLELYCVAEDDRYMGTTWRVSEVTAFIEGPWVEEVNRFAQQVFSLAGQRSAKCQGESKHRELEDLKKKFGL